MVPEFKQNFKYSNIGNVVGTLVYAKAMENSAHEVFGHEFLINAKGFGSINVRVPKIEKSQYAMNNYSVADKPRVRMGLTSLEQFVTDKGKRYINATSFQEMSDPVAVSGAEMTDAINGRLGGEVFNIQQTNDGIRFNLIAYDVDKQGNRVSFNNGKLKEPQVITLDIVDPALIQEFQSKVQNGSNIEVGYRYINKDDITYDEFGFAMGSGNRIERVEVGKLIVHGGGNGAPGPQNSPFGGTPQGNPGGFGPQGQGNNSGGLPNNPPFGTGQTQGQSQGNPFGQNQQQQQQQQNHQQGGFDPFQGQGQQLPQNDPLAQQANQIFGNNGQGNNPFPFGQ